MTANVINVGGTQISLKVPDIESFPPMAGVSNAISASINPNNACIGLPHFTGSVCKRSKYSWFVKRQVAQLPPNAVTLASASTTE